MSENDFENTQNLSDPVPIEKTAGTDSSVSIDPEQLALENEELHEKVKTLTEEVSAAQIENGELKANVLKMTQIIEDHRWEIRRLKNQIDDLTKTPFFIATVMEIFDEEVLIKLHGNNQEILTHKAPDFEDDLEPGMRVAVNGAAYVIMDILSQSTDVRAQVMELIQSPDVSYDQVGGLGDVIQEVIETVELPLTQPELFEKIGIEPPSGVLLYGSPGTGKTLIAKAVATQANATFIRMSGSDLVQKFVGEGARLVKDIFAMARSKAPAILFIDEIDAVGGTRTFDGTSGSAEVNRTMLQLLAEMDGFDGRGDVKIMAATNRKDLLDPALLRPGRFDRAIEVPMPDEKARFEILQIHTKKMNLDSGVDLAKLAKETTDFSGADLNAVAREAGIFVLRRRGNTVTMKDLKDAVKKVKRDEEENKLNAPNDMFA
ncbi:ATP-dependent zinc metalloprotease FtsH [Methanimicrococcus sp. At1]|uniref:ATP-dependent zinc metalloprotease FtsH n=1 Tax=Methanimicrococcus hacksteinii TaxID=3028293 RepID=A0ABU3VQ82_9EURY|nr:proteasome-activating nucleotidase [Methanimicrococcus sp. At1]MDV0445575.1 ATP-dependent zinc metalloprotease FtsH [Methanimicrococcus sp. At1]